MERILGKTHSLSASLWKTGRCCCPRTWAAVTVAMRCSGLLAGYLLREIQKANIAVPEEDESPLAPPPRQVLEIMVRVEPFHEKMDLRIHRLTLLI